MQRNNPIKVREKNEEAAYLSSNLFSNSIVLNGGKRNKRSKNKRIIDSVAM